MQYEKYKNVLASADRLEFRFDSIGPKGRITKLVQFTEALNENIYILAFGNMNKNGNIDEEIIRNNKDRNKILATVASTIYEFTAHHPGKKILFVVLRRNETGFIV